MNRWMGPKSALLIFSLLIGASNLTLSLRSGMLSMPSIYDDCAYLFDAMQRLHYGAFNSALQLAISFISDPPHAPTSTLISMLGFVLFGPERLGPYLVNVGLFVAYAFVIYRLVRTSLSPWSSAFIAAFMLYVPAAHALVTDMFPDMASALVFGVALYLLLRDADPDIALGTLIARGALAAFAVVAKPSAVVVIVPMSGLAALIGAYRPFQRPAMPRAQGHRRFLLTALGALIVFVPFVAIWGRVTWDYDYYVLYSHRDLWITSGSRLFHALYYSVGPGGRLGLADFLYIGLAFLLADAVASRRFAREAKTYGILALYAVVALTYVGMIASGEKDIHQGCFFYFPFLVCATLAIARTVARVAGLRHAVPILLLAIAVVFFKPATIYDFQRVPALKAETANREQRAIVDALVQDLTDPAKATCGMAQLGFIGAQYISAQGLSLDIGLDHHILVEPIDLQDATSVDELRQRVKDVRFVVFPEQGFSSQSSPAAKVAPQFLPDMAADPDWRHVDILGRDLFIRRGC